jgi:hypothetical protein
MVSLPHYAYYVAIILTVAAGLMTIEDFSGNLSKLECHDHIKHIPNFYLYSLAVVRVESLYRWPIMFWYLSLRSAFE